MFRVPLLANTPAFRRTTVLEGQSYIFDVRWAERTASWYMDLRDGDGQLVVAGLRLATDQPLVRRFRRDNAPPGEMMLIAVDGTTQDPGYEDLAVNHVLIYYTEDEVDTANALATSEYPVTVESGA